jgi:GNAT superfamily N-acetyltransferase
MSQMTSVQVQIVSATEGDIPAILAMIKGLARYESFEHLLTANEDNLRDALFSLRPAAEVLLATVDGQCVGFAVYFETFCSILGRRGCFLDHLYIVPECRGMHVGDALMRELASICRKRAYARLEWHVLDWNEPAIGFYKKEGAEFLTDWTKCRMDQTAIEALSGLR